ncbi:hypothetical protein CVIRNUC_011058 [Coccomyxa viridis]|uniref:SHSP domain-containing protein n=1 Tax=Coccomyxa viridis TaxID=1274662 RepID=A0AAV1IMH3_9CHLO|nr:hypothetical protein CVIRNUC_011058 [Coccomyxa viridis]
MAYMVADRRPDPVEKVFYNRRPRFRDPQQIPINVKEVNVNGDVLTIWVPTEEDKQPEGQQTGQAGQQAAKQEEQAKTTADTDTKREISTKFLPRQIRLPQDANTQDIKAEYTDGILTIITHKDLKKRNKKNEIKVQ